MIPIDEGDREIPIPNSALTPLCWLANSQNSDYSFNFSQYTDEGIEPPHPSSRVKRYESPSVDPAETTRRVGWQVPKSQDVRRVRPEQWSAHSRSSSKHTNLHSITWKFYYYLPLTIPQVHSAQGEGRRRHSSGWFRTAARVCCSISSVFSRLRQSFCDSC